MKNINLGLAITIGVVLMLLVALVVDGRVTSTLLLGWIPYIHRTSRRVTMDFDAIIHFAVLLALFSTGLHVAARWLYARITSEQRCWKMRWSGGIVAGVVILFVSGISVTGLFHQTGWIAASPEPVYRSVYVDTWTPNSKFHLKQIGMAAHNYHDVYDSFVPGCTYDDKGTMLHGWAIQILPLLHYRYPKETTVDRKLPWDHPTNAPLYRHFVPDFLNPELNSDLVRDERGFALSHYAANSHVIGWKPAMNVHQITDGTSNTLLMGEVNAGFKAWGSPSNWRDPARGINNRPDGFGGAPGRDGANFVMADGSVRFINDNVSRAVLLSLATPAANDIPTSTLVCSCKFRIDTNSVIISGDGFLLVVSSCFVADFIASFDRDRSGENVRRQI